MHHTWRIQTQPTVDGRLQAFIHRLVIESSPTHRSNPANMCRQEIGAYMCCGRKTPVFVEKVKCARPHCHEVRECSLTELKRGPCNTCRQQPQYPQIQPGSLDWLEVLIKEQGMPITLDYAALTDPERDAYQPPEERPNIQQEIRVGESCLEYHQRANVISPFESVTEPPRQSSVEPGITYDSNGNALPLPVVPGEREGPSDVEVARRFFVREATEIQAGGQPIDMHAYQLIKEKWKKCRAMEILKWAKRSQK